MVGASSSPSDALSPLHTARRLVVKIGSALLVDRETGALRQGWLESLADDVALFRGRGVEVVIVTSGAVGLGRERLGLTPERLGRPLRLEEKQAAAAAGQVRLMQAYEAALARPGLAVAQVLVTPEDTESRRRHLNARATIGTLLGLGAVPVINENDTVATAEIRFGDNDRLAARVAQMVSADTLVLLSDIDGLYTADPRRTPGAAHIPVVHEITAAIEAMAGEPPPGYSSGGMVTKIQAGWIALQAGCRMAIARGTEPGALSMLLHGTGPSGAPRCTWFLPAGEPLTARKRWIAGHVQAMGSLVVDAGAVRALKAGSSLLPAGVTRVEGAFDRGDPVRVLDADGREVARGLAAYAAEDAIRLCGHRSSEFGGILGFVGRDEMIHRDDLVLITSATNDH